MIKPYPDHISVQNVPPKSLTRNHLFHGRVGEDRSVVVPDNRSKIVERAPIWSGRRVCRIRLSCGTRLTEPKCYTPPTGSGLMTRTPEILCITNADILANDDDNCKTQTEPIYSTRRAVGSLSLRHPIGGGTPLVVRQPATTQIFHHQLRKNWQMNWANLSAP